MKSQNNI